MMTTSDDGDKVCPLCAEEMDLTDQQLKPCKCGYEICVWCWHHIMEMAEKEETDGRCPACRTPYDKERIVGMAANCERLVAGMNAARRHKFQKAKPKASAETRKQLSTIRVIQKNLVYIIGLPANLCDERLLVGREYFGQYGNVLKVSISRPSSTTIQHASNNSTFSVYINYAREEEAVRCIQAVNNYILDGRPLRACFGTTKYCHSWLRNMNCSNQDCLYLHDIGSQEDSFTKDELISAYSRVPNIASSSLQGHAGNVLPPPADELTSTGSTTNKHSKTIGQAKVSNGVGSPTVLPVSASWGSRPSNGQLYSQISIKQIVESNNTSAGSSVSTGIKQVSSAWHDDLHTSEAKENSIFITNGMPSLSESQLPKAGVLSDHHSTMCDLTDISFRAGAFDTRDSAWDDAPVTASNFPDKSYDSQVIGRSKMMSSQRFSAVDTKQQAAGIGLSSDSAPVETDQTTILCPSNSASPVLEDDSSGVFSSTRKNMNAENGTAIESLDNHSVASGTSGFTCNYANVNQDAQNFCSVLSLADTDENSEQQRTFLPNPSLSALLRSPASNSQLVGECLGKSILTPPHMVHVSLNTQGSRKLSGWNSESEHQTCQSTGNSVRDLSLSLSDTRHRLSDVTNQRSCSPQLDHSFSESNGQPSCTINDLALSAHSSPRGESVHANEVRGLHLFRQNVHKLAVEQHEAKLSNIYNPASSLDSTLISSNEGLVHLDRFSDIGRADKCSRGHTSESHIISDILSLDFDPWDDSLSIANNFANLLGEKDGREDSVMLSRPLSTQNSSQSRFSFARQENQESLIESSISAIDQAMKVSSVKASYGDAFQVDFTRNVSLGNESTKNRAIVTSDRPTGVSRAEVSAPPGFSLPNREPPPGFAVQDRCGQNFKTTPDIDLIHNSLVGNHHLVRPTENSGAVEFIDPAILAVGKGLMPVGSGNTTFPLGSAFPAQFSSSEYDPRHHFLMQQRVSSLQSMRFPDHSRDNFLPGSDSCIASRLLAQNQSSLSPLAHLSQQQSRSSPVSSSHWDGLSSMQTNTSMGMTDFLRNQRLELSNYYFGKREEKFHGPGSDDIYCRSLGI